MEPVQWFRGRGEGSEAEIGTRATSSASWQDCRACRGDLLQHTSWKDHRF